MPPSINFFFFTLAPLVSSFLIPEMPLVWGSIYSEVGGTTRQQISGLWNDDFVLEINWEWRSARGALISADRQPCFKLGWCGWPTILLYQRKKKFRKKITFLILTWSRDLNFKYNNRIRYKIIRGLLYIRHCLCGRPIMLIGV